MSITIEHAVRATEGNETTIVPVGDEALARQAVAECLERGVPAEPLTRTVTDWTVDQAALARATRDAHREQVLHIAQMYWEGDTDETAAVAQLAEFSALTDHQRAERLGELVSELEHQEDVDQRRVQPGPEEDWDTLAGDAERRVREAADALIGGRR